MGYEAQCRLTLDGRRFEGKATLEQRDLVFRGETRVVIPLQSLDAVAARDGRLSLTFAGRTAVFDLGPAASRWAERISNPPSRARKLGIQPGMRVAVVNVDDEQLIRDVAQGCATLADAARARDLDLLFLGASTAADLARLPAAARRLRPSGAIWLIRTKGAAATIKESESMAAGKRAGLVDIKVVSFSDTASAEKYVVPVTNRALTARTSARPRPRASRPTRRRGSASSPDRT